MVVGVTVFQANARDLEPLLGLPGGRFSAAGATEILDPSRIVESDTERGLIARLNRPITNVSQRTREERSTASSGPVLERNELAMHVYTVKPGDTVWGIAALHRLDPDTIAWTNPLLRSNSHLNIGDTLAIPPVDGAIHRIVSGDTLSVLAQRYEVTVADIVAYEANALDNQSTPLRTGQDLFIPGGQKPPALPATIQYTADAPLGSFQGTGRFRAAVSTGLITQGFWAGHRAIDYAAPLGTPIMAADRGVVAHAQFGWNHGYGNMVVIDHGNGYTTLYAHLATILVRKGDRVQQGQVIGTMGSTGRSTGSHLHLEIRLHGVQQDPSGYILR